MQRTSLLGQKSLKSLTILTQAELRAQKEVRKLIVDLQGEFFHVPIVHVRVQIICY